MRESTDLAKCLKLCIFVQPLDRGILGIASSGASDYSRSSTAFLCCRHWCLTVIIVLVGVVGFVAGLLFDILSASNRSALKGLAWLTTCGCFTAAHIAAALSTDRLAVPPAIRFVGWLLLLSGAALLAYSLFFEIPFRKTYTNATDAPGGLVQDGSYALTRHPGVLWYAILLLGLFLASGSRVMFVAGPVWLLLDATWAWIEDRFTFDRLFPGYAAYRSTTPMLIPTRASATRCWQTLGLAQVGRHSKPHIDGERSLDATTGPKKGRGEI